MVAVEINLVVLKKFNKELPYNLAIPLPRCLPKQVKPGTSVATYGHPCTQQHNSQKVETTQCPPPDEWIKKMWCTHTHINIIHKKILISHKKGGNSATYNNTAESLGHYAKSNKSDRERQIWYDFNYMWNIKQLNS